MSTLAAPFPELYHTLVHQLAQAYCLVEVQFDAQGAATDYRYLEVNAAFERLSPHGNLVGRTLRELAPAHAPYWLALYGEVARTGQGQAGTKYAHFGHNHWLEVLALPTGPAGSSQVAVFFTDTMAQNLAQNRYRLLFELMDQGFGIAEVLLATATTPTDVRWLDVNPPFRELTGLTEAQLSGGQTVRQLAIEVEEEWYTHYEQVVRTGEPAHFELYVRRRGAWFDVHAFRVEELGSNRVAVLFRNSTARKQAEQQQQVVAVLAGQEEERRRIAEDLHNGLGQLLYATKLQFDRLLPPPTEAAFYREATRLLSTAIQQVRDLSHELAPALLVDFGLQVALQSICRELSTRTLHWQCHLALDEAPPLSPTLQLAVYRLAQGLAHNVAKHAHATEATLEVTVLPGWVTLRLEDNGRGFEPTTVQQGLGLRTLHSRVALLHGNVRIDSAPGEGTQLLVRLPIAPHIAPEA